MRGDVLKLVAVRFETLVLIDEVAAARGTRITAGPLAMRQKWARFGGRTGLGLRNGISLLRGAPEEGP